MDLVAAIEKIIELSDAPARTIIDVGQRTYSTQQIHRVKRPQPECLKLSTLRGFVDYVNHETKSDGGNDLTSLYMVTIDSHLRVSLRSEQREIEEDFELLALASADQYISNFKFGYQYSIEDFMINLQTCFKASDQRNQLIQVSGNMSSDSESRVEDDGVTQSTTVGRAVKTKVAIKNPILLSPFRTFQEVEQVESPFIFRINASKNGEPTISLYESDCGEWKIKAIENIYSYLVKAVEGVKIYR